MPSQNNVLFQFDKLIFCNDFFSPSNQIKNEICNITASLRKRLPGSMCMS